MARDRLSRHIRRWSAEFGVGVSGLLVEGDEDDIGHVGGVERTVSTAMAAAPRWLGRCQITGIWQFGESLDSEIGAGFTRDSARDIS